MRLLMIICACLLSPVSLAAAFPDAQEQKAAPPSSLPADGGIPMQTLHLAMDALDAEVLFRKEPHDDSKFPVTVADGDKRMPGTIQVKGSFTRNFLKKSLLIKLKKGQSWNGYRKISLNGMPTDPTSMREWLAWSLVDSLGMAHPAVKYTRLYINERFIGLFLFIEWMEPPMFARYGAGDDGEFYHPIDSTHCADLMPEGLSDLPKCWYKLAPRDKDFSTLAKLIKDIDATPAAEFDKLLEKNFDIASLLNWILINTIVSSTDTYNKNYFFYFSKKNQKWIAVPWDYDLTFGRGADYGLPFPQTILNDNFQYYYSAESGNPNPLIQKTLKNPVLFKRFRAHLRHTFGLRREEGMPEKAFGWFEPRNFRVRLAQLEEAVASELRQDYYDPIKPAEFERHVDTLKFYNLMRYHYLKYQVLVPSVFNTPRWVPFHSSPRFEEDEIIETREPSPFPEERTYLPLVLAASVNLSPGRSQVVPVDEQLARPLGVLNVLSLDRPARVRVEVEMERRPTALPPGINDPEQCIQRNWFLDLKTPGAQLELGVVLDYLQEHSNHHERGALVNDDNEVLLDLWLRQGENWTQVPAKKNSLANTLSSGTLRVVPGQVMHFTACLPNSALLPKETEGKSDDG